MPTITKQEIADLITTTLGAAAAVVVSQSANQLTEGLHELPAIQVYPTRWEVDIAQETDRSSFGAGIRQTELVFIVDVYAHRRTELAEDMGTMMTVTDEIDALLDAQVSSLFGNADIKAFHWFAELASFEYGGSNVRYTGARYTITIEVF